MSKHLENILFVFRLILMISLFFTGGFYRTIILTIIVASLWIEAIKAPHQTVLGWSSFFGLTSTSNLKTAIVSTVIMVIYWSFVGIFYFSNRR
ncbi:MAG: hypothetical protein AB7E30_04450 [Lawsonibacter sp.]